MAFNLRQAMNLGHQLWRVYDRFSRTQAASRRASVREAEPGRDRAPDAGASAEARERTAAYPGDFTGRVRAHYAPIPGPEAGPGEVVWTWVPFEELDGRGKDRPVLVIGTDGRWLLAVQLTSRDRNNGQRRDVDYVDVGSGDWDRAGRASEAYLGRIVRVDPAQVRREGGVVDARTFERVAKMLGDVQGW